MKTEKNFKTKKALKEAVQRGDQVYCIANSQFDPTTYAESNGSYTIEGPNFGSHTWAAIVRLERGLVKSVK